MYKTWVTFIANNCKHCSVNYSILLEFYFFEENSQELNNRKYFHSNKFLIIRAGCLICWIHTWSSWPKEMRLYFNVSLLLNTPRYFPVMSYFFFLLSCFENWCHIFGEWGERLINVNLTLHKENERPNREILRV